MRIALISPEYPGCGPSFGIGRYVQLLARGLSNIGDAVCVIVINEQGTWLGHADEVHPVSRLPIPALLRPWWTQSWVERVLNDLAPDIIEVPNWGGLGALLPKQWPVLARLSTSIAQERAPDRLRKYLQAKHLRMEKATVRRADFVVADSPAIAEICAPLYRRAADSIIPHALPFTPPALEDLSSTTGTDVLYVGRLEFRKGIDVLLRAWLKIHAQFPNTRLHIVGKDRFKLSTALQVAKRSHIVFHGLVSDDELAEIYKKCQIQVVPSRFESFGIVVLEAWAHGVAVIASAIPALQNTVANAGVLFPVNDHHQLASELRLLLADKNRCAELRDIGYKRLQHYHHMSSWIAATRKAYAQTIEISRQRQKKQFKN